MEQLNKTYQNFIINKLHNNNWTDEDYNIAFFLHNYHAGAPTYEANKKCSSCIKRVITFLRQKYNQEIINEFITKNTNNE